MSDTHEVNVVRVGPILPHPNAERLQLTMVGGYQVVIGKDQFKEGDLAVYIQPDSVVPQTEPFRFIWNDHIGIDGKVPEKRRRITVKRLRKEYSEGLLMPAKDVIPELVKQDSPLLTEGTNVADVIGVTRYVPEFDVESSYASTAAAPKQKYPKTLKGWFYFILRRLGLHNAGGKSYAAEVAIDCPEYDVNALKNAKRVTFREGEEVTITEKIHGSNARFTFILDNPKNPMGPGKFYAGSHRQWKMQGDNVWWKAVEQFPVIKSWCQEHPGLILYGEVGPTQKGFRYGASEGEVFFFAFDVYSPVTKQWGWPGNFGVPYTPPILYVGPYSAEIVKQFVDGPSVVPGAKVEREGIVIHSRERRLKLKVVSNNFLLGDSK